ncbi:uncharacterized protein LOC119652430 isoform X2 [Hermetia illucens]|uniref:uncharacterized protein LOC119652430 isoform X2 n=1 Tax=Hermetia illucens TaxID=343691 RepID=UPI0018CC756B|nr:uncharacterized protein LOC119652430 isoform X2 [Hermetia illucens]
MELQSDDKIMYLFIDDLIQNSINDRLTFFYFLDCVSINMFGFLATLLFFGSNIKTAIAILNCILARQLCFEDPSCSAILEIIPRVCGPVPVACSTVTVTKCQAALRTLQAFPFFRPTCLCKEPGVDPDCNNFRDFLFDHPCGFVLKKEKDPFPVDALPTCNHALSVCQHEKVCNKVYEDFKAHCKVRDNKCRMEDRDVCHESWTNLRMSPMFGCICPNNHMKRRCDRIFSIVNHNPCIVRKIGMDDNYHQSVFDESMELIQTPLIAPSSTHYLHHHKVVSYPYNITAFQGGNSPKDTVITNYTDKKSAQDTSADSSSEIIKLHFQSTCHTALDACREDSSCLASLQPMLIHCELHRCNRNACMSALQSFYKGPHEDLSLDIAFCLCKKTSNRHDICMLAQEKLHPACAQRPPDSINPQNSNGIVYHPPPACHSVADLCKEDPDCRIKLERYEQACAVDSVTKKCAGRPSSCRSAMLGILGTQLRMTCACHGTEFPHLYECLGWQRLLWLNPCVVEAQKDFHVKRLAELGLLTTTSTTTTRSPPIVVLTTNRISLGINEPFNTKHHSYTPVGKTELPVETNYIESPDVYPEHFSGEQNNIEDAGNNANEAASEEQSVTVTTSSTLEIETTTMTTTTTTTTMATTTTTVAPRNCVVQRPHQSDQLVPEGSSRRIYSLDDVECSELCTCGESLTLACHALCVPFAPCRTPLAFYNHASPAYQAFRGRCLCYSGRFICMRPPPGEYLLPGGVFLLLGYSSTDEALLRPHTNLGVQDAVRALQNYVLSEIDNQTSCTLTLFNMTDENIIISARLPHDPKVKSIEMLRREKEECTSILETISHHINSEHSELQAHRLLSIFKMSEVQVVWPETSSAVSLSIVPATVVEYFWVTLPTMLTTGWTARGFFMIT